VGGEVRNPARQIYFGDGMTVLKAIDTASGFTDFANRDKIELRRANGQKFTIKWKKALQDPKLDLPVFPNDQITVHKRMF
jgi:protein involved in polysaccharide export with SLBB domain